MHYRAISYINLPKTYDDAILAQFVVHHATDSNRMIRVECLRCRHTCQIFKCRFAVGQLSVNCWYGLPADSWPTVYRQTFRGAVLHFLPKLLGTFQSVPQMGFSTSCRYIIISPLGLALQGMQKQNLDIHTQMPVSCHLKT